MLNMRTEELVQLLRILLVLIGDHISDLTTHCKQHFTN